MWHKLTILFLILLAGCSEKSDDRSTNSSGDENTSKEKPPAWPGLDGNDNKDVNEYLELQYKSRNEFINAWRDGSIKAWPELKDEKPKAKCVFDYIDVNIKIYGIRFWAALPDAAADENLSPKIDSKEYKLLVELRDWAYKELNLANALGTLKKVDVILEEEGDVTLPKQDKLKQSYLSYVYGNEPRANQ